MGQAVSTLSILAPLTRTVLGIPFLYQKVGSLGLDVERVWLMLGIDIEYIPGYSIDIYEEPAYEFCDGTFGWEVRLDNSTALCVTGVEWTWIAYYSTSELENGIQYYGMRLLSKS